MATAPPGRAGLPRRRVVHALIGAAVLVCLYLALPRLAGLEHTWQRIRDGNPAWLLAAVVAEAGSFAGYVWLLRRIASRPGAALPWPDAWRITLAGVAATRIVTVAGAGGIAVTISGLRQAGFTTREAAERQAVDLVALYGVFFGLMVADGVLLTVVDGHHPGLTVLPALLGTVVIALALGVALVPETFEGRLRGRFGRRVAAAGAVPAVLAAGVRGTLELLRRRERALAGAWSWWLLDIAALWASIHAFGGAIGVPEVVMAYLAGHAFNVLPVPGGVGPVEGGTIAALIAFGEPAGLALVGVLAYQLISVWMPAAPGAVALATLRRRSPTVRSPEPPPAPAPSLAS